MYARYVNFPPYVWCFDRFVGQMFAHTLELASLSFRAGSIYKAVRGGNMNMNVNGANVSTRSTSASASEPSLQPLEWHAIRNNNIIMCNKVS